MSFFNVAIRGRFRWTYDGVYQDNDGSLGAQPGSVIMAPDGLTNSSSICTSIPNFSNAIQCPLWWGSWLRFSLTQPCSGPLTVTADETNSSTTVLCLQQQPYSQSYTMFLRRNQTYLFTFSSVLVS